MSSMEYYSFDRVLKELQIEEDELKRLVSEGEIRAFRDEDKMKFKKSDIEGLKKGRMTEPTIILPSGDPDDSAEDSEVLLVEEDTSETLLDIDDLDTDSSASVPTVDFSSDFDSTSGPSTDELSFEEDSSSYVLESADDVLINSSQELASVGDLSSGDLSSDSYIETDTGMQTEPLDMSGTDSSFGDDSVMDDMNQTQPMDESHLDDLSGESSVYTDATHEMAFVRREEPISGGLAACILITTVVMLYSVVFLVNINRDVDDGTTSKLTDVMYGFVPARHLSKRGNPTPSAVNTQLKWRAKQRRQTNKR